MSSVPDTPRKEGPWLIHGEDVAFDNPWFRVMTYPVTMPNTGEPGVYGVIRFKNMAVGVLPIDEEGYTWIVGQHRFPMNEYSWELPEGGGALDVAPEISAARELEEETGLRAEHLTHIGRWYISNSVTDEFAHGFIATGLSPGQFQPDASEVLERKRIKFSELLRMVMDGEVTDAFAVLIVQTAYIKAAKGQLEPELANLILKND